MANRAPTQPRPDRPRHDHVLLTVLGVNPQETPYELDGRTVRASVASAALYELLPEAERPTRVLALCTERAADESLPLLRSALDRIEVDEIRIDEGTTPEALRGFLRALAQHAPAAGSNLTVDVTNGLRHLSFLTYAGVLYLTALRGIHLHGAYYGMLRGGMETADGEKLSPFVDVRPLVELPQWFHAVMTFHETGSARAMATLAEQSTYSAASEGAAAALVQLSEAFEWALPIELGSLAAEFSDSHLEPFRELLHAEGLPLADELIDEVAAGLDAQRLTTAMPGVAQRSALPLDRTELERQARIIGEFLRKDNLRMAFGLMREWMVLWAMWRLGTPEGWLNYRARQAVANSLSDLADDLGQPGLSDHERDIATAWKHLRNLRNAYSHHSLNPEVTLSTDSDTQTRVISILRIWYDTLQSVPQFDFALPAPKPRGGRR